MERELYSTVISDLLDDLRQRVAIQADTTVLRGAQRKLEELEAFLDETVWAWRLSKTLSDLKQEEEGISEVRENTRKLMEYVSSNILKPDEKSRKVNLQVLEQQIDFISKRISNLNETSTKNALRWKEKIEQRCEGLQDFSDLLDKNSLKRLLSIQDHLESMAITTAGLATLSGKDKKTMKTKVAELNGLEKKLERIENKLKPETIETEYGVSRKTVDILKRLVKGDIITVSELSLENIKDLRNSRKLSKKITVRYIGKSERELRQNAILKWEKEKEERRGKIRRVRDAEIL